MRSEVFCTAWLFLAAATLWGDVTFTDTTFNLSDYAISYYKSDPGIQITVQQSQNGGNPGQALEILYTLPPINGVSFVGLVRPSFSYDPSAQGAIQSIGFSIDKYVTETGCDTPSCQLNPNTVRPTILQNGQYYMAVISIPAPAATWITFKGTLHASDFGLFDFASGTSNTAINPSFTSGVMQLGFTSRDLFQVTQTTQADVLFDNLAITVHATPATAPTITAIVPAADTSSNLSPGAPMLITGTNLGTSSSDAAAIQIGGKAAPLLSFTSSTNMLVQVPVEVAPGSTSVTATYKGQTSAAFNVMVDAFTPAIYNPTPSAFTDGNGNPITSSAPAVPGMPVSLTAIGLGTTNPPMVDGTKATAQAPTVTPVQVMVGNKMVAPNYAGLLVGSVTDYLVTFNVPEDAPVGAQPVTISVGGVTSNSVTLQVAPPIPLINAIVNGATFKARGAAPNSFVTFFGLNFGNQDTSSNIFPATQFNGVSVLFNGTAAPLYFVFGSAGQINLVLPSELPETGNVTVEVENPQGTSASFQLKMAASDVGLFRIPDPSNPSRNNGAVLFANTQWRVMPASMAAAIGFPSCVNASAATVCAQPAKVGDALQFYLTGLGKATPGGDPNGQPLATGSVAPADGSTLYETVATPTVTVGGVPAQVIFSGITPGNAGLYQINLTVPAGVQPGDDVPVSVTMPNGSSDTVTIAISQ